MENKEVNIDFKHLVKYICKRGGEWPLLDMGPSERIQFRSNELAGDAGETANQVKKYIRHLKGMRGPDDSIEKISEEIGDVIISAILLAVELDLNPAHCVVDKYNKTSEKYNIPLALSSLNLSIAEEVEEVEEVEDLYCPLWIYDIIKIIENNLDFPDTITDVSIVKYYDDVDVELAKYLNEPFDNIREDLILTVKQTLVQRNNGVFFGSTNTLDAMVKMREAVNRYDIYKIVGDPVSDMADYHGYIGFKYGKG